MIIHLVTNCSHEFWEGPCNEVFITRADAEACVIKYFMDNGHEFSENLSNELEEEMYKFNSEGNGCEIYLESLTVPEG